MKTRVITIVILLLILAAMLTRNDQRITETLLNVINPIKQKYKNLTQGIEDKSHSYIFQKESIEKLTSENRLLRKQLLEQTHYIQEVKDIYTLLPDLSKLPIHNVSISETISYVKLNSFSQLILTKPAELHKDKLYGLIQKNVVAGVASLENNQLYAFLTSDDKCRFSVFIGKEYAPGIAIGVKTNEMIVKFIPKWYKIKTGDKVVTSGLDDIFFTNIPVGIVTKIELQSSYKVAYIKTYSDIYHPKTFFLVNNAKATIAEGFDSNRTLLKPYKVNTVNNDINTSISVSSQRLIENNLSIPSISSIPSRIDQTQEEIIEPEIPAEVVEVAKPKKVSRPRKIYKPRKSNKPKKVNRPKKTPKASSLDLF